MDECICPTCGKHCASRLDAVRCTRSDDVESD